MSFAQSDRPPIDPILRLAGADRHERIEAIKAGIPAREGKNFLAALTLPTGLAMTALNLSAATINRKSAAGQLLSPEDSERVLGMAKLVNQVQTMVADSGASDGFDAFGWVSQWLREPVPALDGQRPLDLLDTMEGQTLVSELLARMQSGAYA